MEKQTQEYYQNFEKETQQKKQSYQSSNTHGDVIDVDYTIVEETED
ncbi:hypothetical protein [Tannockella kyphosi]|nr:hypothetical protein [Tannockella kyphosi]